MTIEERKKVIQDKAYQAWVDNDYRGTEEIATGVGKTKLGVQAAIEEYKSNPDAKILWGVPKEKLRDDDAPAEFQKWGAADIWANNVVSECYQTLYKWEGHTWDLAVMDEIHNSLTDEYGKVYKNNSFKKLMGLSATIPFDKGLLLMPIAPICFTYTLQEALDDGVVSPFAATVILHTLDSKSKTILAGTKKNPFYVTEVQMYNYINKQIQVAYATKKSEFIKSMQIQRLQFMYNLPSKIEPAKRLLNKLAKEKTIVFANSTKMLDLITPNGVHSNKSDDDNQLILDSFGTGKTNVIGSAEKLKEGVNLEGLLNLLMVSYNSSAKDFVQKVGRVVRYDENKLAKLYIFKTLGTQEESWYNKMSEDVDLSKATLIQSNML